MSRRIIFQNPETGIVAVVVPAPGVSMERALQDVPADLLVTAEEVPTESIPVDRTFRGAWFHDLTEAPQKVGVEMTKAKDITHDRRRLKRSAEFAPLDIEATIPTMAESAEAVRQVIREKYDTIQVNIDACTTPESLKVIIDTEGI